jgi:hypothetical protein
MTRRRTVMVLREVFELEFKFKNTLTGVCRSTN